MKKQNMKKGFIACVIAASSMVQVAQAQWSLTGNAGTVPGTNFVGTTDAKALNFKTSNSTRMVITSSGRVGIGVNSPTSRLDVAATNGTSARFKGDLILDGSSATFGAGVIGFRNTTSGLQWNVEGGPDYWTVGRINVGYDLSIYNNGNVGIGTGNVTPPAAKLDVNGDTRVNGLIRTSKTAPLGQHGSSFWAGGNDNGPLFPAGTPELGIRIFNNSLAPGQSTIQGWDYSVNQARDIVMNDAGGKIGIGTSLPTATLSVNGTADKPGGGSWAVFSDARLKQDVKTYNDGLSTLLKIAPVTYRYNEKSGCDTKPQYVGVIAQELQKIAPYMVDNFTKDGADYLRVDNSAMTYMLINAVKELSTQLQDLQAENTDLKSCVESLCNNPSNTKAGISEASVSSLQQNQPNPFSQSTVINYNLSNKDSRGMVLIRDINGNLMKSINVNGSGKGQVTVNANELSQGTYTYTLVIEGKSIDTKLMVITK
jgi:hypothetical protein